MRDGYFGIWLTLAIIVGVMVMFQVLGSLGVVIFYGIHEENWNAQGVLLINSVAQLLTLGGGAWLVTASARQNLSQVFRLDGLRSRASAVIYILILPMILLSQALGAGLASLWMHFLELFPTLYDKLEKVQDLLDSSMKKLVVADDPLQLVVGLIAIAMIPAMCEELFFRGFALANIERSGKNGLRTTTAIIVTGIAFGVSHLSPLNFPAIIVLGLVFGWVLTKTNDIRVTMTAHFINNGIIVVALYTLKPEQEITDSLLSSETLPLDESLMLTVTCGVVLLAILSIIGKLADKNKPSSPPNEPRIPDQATHE